MAFPLRLTPFEEYMFADDRPEYPMLGFFRLRFSALLDAAALESSLQATLSRHPLTTCKILRRGWRYFWIPDENFRPKLECFVPDASRNYPEAKWIDPTAESCTPLLSAMRTSLSRSSFTAITLNGTPLSSVTASQ